MIFKIFKGFALLTPLVISLIVLIGCMVLSFGDSANQIDGIEVKLNIGLSIIGLAITVWVGLNIYNVLERKEIDYIKSKLTEIEKRSIDTLKLQEHYVDQAILQGKCLSDLTEVIKMKELLVTEKGLLGGSEFSYIDCIEGFVNAFNKYARENTKLDSPFKLDIFELFEGYMKGLKLLASEGWHESGSHLRNQDITQVQTIIDAVNSMIRDQVIPPIDLDDQNSIKVTSLIYTDLIETIKYVKNKRLNMIIQQLNEQLELVIGSETRLK